MVLHPAFGPLKEPTSTNDARQAAIQQAQTLIQRQIERAGAMVPADRPTQLGLTAVWGLSFAVIKIGLNEVPPLLYCSVGFALVASPAVLFLQTPGAQWPIVMVAPYILMVPTFGLLGASGLIGEPRQRWKLVAAELMFAGLGINRYGQAVIEQLRRPWAYWR